MSIKYCFIWVIIIDTNESVVWTNWKSLTTKTIVALDQVSRIVVIIVIFYKQLPTEIQSIWLIIVKFKFETLIKMVKEPKRGIIYVFQRHSAEKRAVLEPLCLKISERVAWFVERGGGEGDPLMKLHLVWCKEYRSKRIVVMQLYMGLGKFCC